MKANENNEMRYEEVSTSVVVYRSENDEDYDWVEYLDNVKQAKEAMKENDYEKWMWMACIDANLSGNEAAYAKTEAGAVKKLNEQLKEYGIVAYDPFKCKE